MLESGLRFEHALRFLRGLSWKGRFRYIIESILDFTVMIRVVIVGLIWVSKLTDDDYKIKPPTNDALGEGLLNLSKTAEWIANIAATR